MALHNFLTMTKNISHKIVRYTGLILYMVLLFTPIYPPLFTIYDALHQRTNIDIPSARILNLVNRGPRLGMPESTPCTLKVNTTNYVAIFMSRNDQHLSRIVPSGFLEEFRKAIRVDVVCVCEIPGQNPAYFAGTVYYNALVDESSNSAWKWHLASTLIPIITMSLLRVSRNFLGNTMTDWVAKYEFVLGIVSTPIFAVQYLSYRGLRDKYLFYSICAETGVLFSLITAYFGRRCSSVSDIDKYRDQLLECLEEVKMEISNNQTSYLKYPLLKSQILKKKNEGSLYQQQRYNPLLTSIFAEVDTQIQVLDNRYTQGKQKHEQKSN